MPPGGHEEDFNIKPAVKFDKKINYIIGNLN